MRKNTLKKMRVDRAAYLEQQPQRMSKAQEDMFFAAVHEAGHCLAHILTGDGVEYADVERKVVTMPNGQPGLSTGFTQPVRRLPLTRETIEQEAVCIMAGPAAENRVNSAPQGELGDINFFRGCAAHVGLTPNEARELLERAYYAAVELVDKHLPAVKQIAFELMTKGRLDGDTIKNVVEHPDAQYAD
jgi:ATP-dependent Zn protease